MNISDWNSILEYYGQDCIRNEMMQSRDLDPKTLSFFSFIFEVPKEQFRCYNTIQSNPGHWVY